MTKAAELVELRKDWTLQDYVEAYEDEWVDEMPNNVEECRKKMLSYIENTYDEEYIEECIENES